ncbi:ATP-binding protein [Bacteroidales bacterium OttesenSCG-928-L03]|nr:ATP-binding protein [Bacteroidales bacterium OttesenSCG-928-L03]
MRKLEEQTKKTVEKTTKASKTKKTQTTLEHLERIVELVVDSKLDEDFYKKAKTSIDQVSRKLNLSSNQVILFALFIEKSDDYRTHIGELAHLIGCRLVRLLSMMTDVDELEKRRLVRCRRSDDKPSYRVPQKVIQALKQDRAYEPENTKGLDTPALFQHLASLFKERENNEISHLDLFSELKSLLDDNPNLAFVKQVQEYNSRILFNDEEWILFLFFCHSFINEDDDCLGFHNINEIIKREEERIFKRIKTSFKKGTHEFLEYKLIENVNDKGFVDKEYYKLTDQAKESLFVDLDIDLQQAVPEKDLLLYDSIKPKDLFYNRREQAQIEQLAALLNKEHFRSVQARLEENGMRKGFACLFYGAPGTGKTETVYQLARSTGRDIMMVDISETKSMWYGESEKRIKKIFEKYRSLLKTTETAPILLFNEADAVIGKRKETGRNGSIDQTENTIQNILLQEMEDLEGIMIATTNLTQNLDQAFERRFLYKIEFEKPCLEAKEKIWQTMLPSLSEQDRMSLAQNYNFSGGQIENIVRKYTIDSILNNTTPSHQALDNYCRSEFLYKEQERRRIGFF